MDYPSAADLEEGYEVDSPDAEDMILDAVVGIMDPLRGDVKEAVATAQAAGVMVRGLFRFFDSYLPTVDATDEVHLVYIYGY